MYNNYPRPKYPFLKGWEFSPEALCSPHAARLVADTYMLMEAYSDILPEEVRKKYVRMKPAMITARMLPDPYATYEHMAMCNRVTIWMLVQDDYYELATRNDLELYRQRFEALWNGAAVTPEDNGVQREIALSVAEMTPLMSDRWRKRCIRLFNYYFRYGMGGEAPYKAMRKCPPLAEFYLIREFAVAAHPYMICQDVMHQFELPQYVQQHPVIRQLTRLNTRIMAWQNDFYTLPKEIDRDSEKINLVLVLQREYDISLEDAWWEALRISDEDIMAFHALYDALPDFGDCQDLVKRYVAYMMAQVQGLQFYYEQDTVRYTKEVWADPGFNPGG